MMVFSKGNSLKDMTIFGIFLLDFWGVLGLFSAGVGKNPNLFSIAIWVFP